MGNLYSAMKGDYLQRSRSYAFLITLFITIYAAHSFVPMPEANYTTLTIPGYKGVYNSAWAGHVSALMINLTLALCGFYLVNGAIKKDIDTEVGLIIAGTPITNFGYLFIKFLGNFLILLTISSIAVLVGIVMFFIQNSGYPFYVGDFLLPYFFMIIPSMVLIAGVAIVAEVFLRRMTIFQSIAYFFIFIFMILGMVIKSGNSTHLSDSLGMEIITNSIQNQVNKQFNENISGVSLGYSDNNNSEFKTFVWNGVLWNTSYLINRFIWIALTFLLVYISSFFFHRFDFKQSLKSNLIQKMSEEKTIIFKREFKRSVLPTIIPAYGIMPFIKTELLLIIRKNSKWLWLINTGLWISTLFAPLQIAYAFLLPALFFLQVNRISDLTTKEVTNRIHYFTFASYKPLQRILPAQILAGSFFLTALSLPVILRLLINAQFIPIIQIMNGIVFIISLSVCLGIVTYGKKLFEILFLLITYVVFQAPDSNYLGTINYNGYAEFINLFIVSNLLLILSFATRKYQLRNL